MNVVLVQADQLSAKWLGCYGNAVPCTPHLDALAAQGVRFERCFSNHPVCMPSRASAVTGRSAQHHGVFYNGWELDAQHPTFPQLLQRQGVQTFGVGKFHLECHGRSAYNDVRKYGFDRAEVTEDIRAGDWLDWIEREHPEHASTALATVWPTPHLDDYGPAHRDLNREIREARAAQRGGPGGARRGASTPIPEELCQTHWITDRAIAFLTERDPERPFYLNVSFVDPHDPYDPPERFLERIDPDLIPATVQSTDPSLQDLVARLRQNHFVKLFEDTSEEEWRLLRRHYLASLAFLDEQVGRLLEEIEALGLKQDTAIVFTADHGDTMGDHGLPTKGSWHLDACMRVPLILSVPGLDAPGACGRVTSTLDLFPTICRLTGVPCSVPVEGAALTDLLDPDSTAAARPDAALVETYGAYGSREGPFRARSVVTSDARFTRFGDGFPMLFDTRNDPDETVNLAGTAQGSVLETDLKDIMLALWDRQNEPPPDRYKHPCAGH